MCSKVPTPTCTKTKFRVLFNFKEKELRKKTKRAWLNTQTKSATKYEVHTDVRNLRFILRINLSKTYPELFFFCVNGQQDANAKKAVDPWNVHEH